MKLETLYWLFFFFLNPMFYLYFTDRATMSVAVKKLANGHQLGNGESKIYTQNFCP